MFILSNVKAIADETKPTTGYDGGFYIKSSDDNYKLKFNANLQMRYEYQVRESNTDINTFAFPRTRLIFTGNVFTPKLTYMIMPEMGDIDQTHTGTNVAQTANLYMRDLWFDYACSDYFQIRLGQFFLPRHRQAYTISTAQQFGEFPITALSDFSFAWDRGIDFHGAIAKLDYDLYLVNGTGGNITNTGKGINIGTRLVYNLFGKYGYTEGDTDYSEKPNLAIGGHISFNNSDNYNKAAAAPGGATPEYLLTSGDAAFKYKGFSLEAEFIDLYNNIGKASNPAFTVQAGYFLIPKKWEVAGQASRIFWNGSDNDWSEYIAGTSYYLKGHKLKIHATYSLLKFDLGNPVDAATFTGANDQVNHRFRILFGFAI